MEFSMYSQRCVSAGSVVACSACDVLRLDASPYLSPCTLAKLGSAKQHIGLAKAGPVMHMLPSCSHLLSNTRIPALGDKTP